MKCGGRRAHGSQGAPCTVSSLGREQHVWVPLMCQGVDRGQEASGDAQREGLGLPLDRLVLSNLPTEFADRKEKRRLLLSS